MKADFLSLAAGPEQVHTIDLAKSLGWRVMAFDRNPQAPGLAKADIAVAMDAASDIEGVARRAKAAGVRALLPIPLGAMLEVAGVLNDRLGLPGVSASAARLAADKLAQRKCLKAAGLPQPSFRACEDASEIMAAVRAWVNPALSNLGLVVGVPGFIALRMKTKPASIWIGI